MAADHGEIGRPVRMVERAYDIAAAAHSEQVDKAGQPYLRHPVRVAQAVAPVGLVHVAVALLHDVVEDTDVTLADLREAMPEQVVEAVDALTHRKGEPRADYYERVAANPIALVVKRADIADNMSPDRLAALDSATAQRLRKKYAQALDHLGFQAAISGSSEVAS